MQWSDEIQQPYVVDFKLARVPGTRTPLDADTTATVRSCAFKSAVYIVSRNSAPQYVGESSNVCSRFIAGVRREDNGYMWPESGGSFTVYFFEVPSEPHFRKAIEIEVMLLLRLHTGFWPIESSGAKPFHQLRSSGEINLASARAREIFGILCQLDKSFGRTTVEGASLIAAFDSFESKIGRR